MSISAYLAQCADGTLYAGVTGDPARRQRQHNGELAGGARYTASRRPVRIVWSQRFRATPEGAREARRAEARIKRMTRAQKIELIEGRRTL